MAWVKSNDLYGLIYFQYHGGTFINVADVNVCKTFIYLFT